MLGLYDDEGNLHNLGVASSFSVARRAELRDELAPFITDDWSTHPWGRWADAAAHESGDGGRLPGGQSRWNAKKDLSFTPLRPELVAEVAYDRVDNGRFRHSCRFQHWRPDRTPESCTFEQLKVVPRCCCTPSSRPTGRLDVRRRFAVAVAACLAVASCSVSGGSELGSSTPGTAGTSVWTPVSRVSPLELRKTISSPKSRARPPPAVLGRSG